MPTPDVPASITLKTFCCPHCGAYSPQTWYDAYVKRESGDGLPTIMRPGEVDSLRKSAELPKERRDELLAYFDLQASGALNIEPKENSKYVLALGNLSASKCFACEKISLWVYDRLIYPEQKAGPDPNPDLGPEVLRDYEEAQGIVGRSPRGVAALLRLAIQKLCIQLGEPGKHLADDIAALVRKGLSPLVQKALDIVRVIGNESVHPGVIDMRDDVGTATQLFKLVNIIAEQMISNPKHVDAMYASLPEAKRQAIEKRDGKGKPEPAQ